MSVENTGKFQSAKKTALAVPAGWELVPKVPWTLGNKMRVVGGTWHWYYHFVYSFHGALRKDDPIGTKTQQRVPNKVANTDKASTAGITICLRPIQWSGAL